MRFVKIEPERDVKQRHDASRRDRDQHEQKGESRAVEGGSVYSPELAAVRAVSGGDAKLQSPAKWTDKILMTRDARGWIIDNIQYAGGNAPMRSGTLQDAMRMVLKRDAAPIVPLAPAVPAAPAK